MVTVIRTQQGDVPIGGRWAFDTVTRKWHELWCDWEWEGLWQWWDRWWESGE